MIGRKCGFLILFTLCCEVIHDKEEEMQDD
jgi:hypothetical protein